MDNRQIDITSEGSKALTLVLTLLWDNCPGRKATHYKVAKYEYKADYYGNPTDRHYEKTVESEEGKQTLILLWHAENGALPLPYPLDLDDAIKFVEGWLKNADYKDEPDHDGDNGKGWRVFNEQWGYVAGHNYAILGVQPVWAMYGK